MSTTKITFSPDVPVDLALAYPEGKPVDSKFKGKQMMFSAVDGRVAYLPFDAGQEIQAQLRSLGIRPGQRILIAMEKEYSASGAKVAWKVYRAGEIPIGEQRDGSFVVPSQPGAAAAQATILQSPPAMENTENSGTCFLESPAPELHQGWAQLTLGQANALTDVYALALRHAAQYPGVTPADVREFVVEAFRRRGNVDIG